MTDQKYTTIIGNVPSKSNCYKIGVKTLYKTKALSNYEKSFYMQIGALRNKNITSLFEFHSRIYYPSMRSDLDNSQKILLDCLQKTMTIKNDNLCVKLVAEKFIDKKNPRVEFYIKEIN